MPRSVLLLLPVALVLSLASASAEAAGDARDALRGMRLGQVRTALRRAHCRLGHVRRRGKRRLVVRSQTVRAGKQRASGTRVGITLAPRSRARRS